MKIPANEIHVYRAILKKSEYEVLKLEKILSSDELEKAYKYKFENDRNNYISGRALLRSLLGKYLLINPSEINFSYTEKGKPFIEGNDLKFNLAHSQGYVVYAFALKKEVGIDVEFQKNIPDALKIAERYFSDYEIKEFKKISSENIKQSFFNCWTRKEAFIKAIGEGLSYPLADFSVSLKPGDEAELLWIKSNSGEVKYWTLYNVDVMENYTCSLAIKSREMKITYKDINKIS